MKKHRGGGPLGSHAAKNPYASVNPKDILAAAKLPVHLIPETLYLDVALAFLEGALKYGKYNWRAKPVKATVYLDAMDRHIMKYKAGERIDTKTKVKHMGYIICCAAILNDAEYYGTLIDDRAPRGLIDPNMSWYIDNAAEIIKHLQEMFKGANPKQYTIQDMPHNAKNWVPAKKSTRRKAKKAKA